ncbi:MAG TPA: glutathione synthase [bacterium]|nr:glutathione synthase [bacterium]
MSGKKAARPLRAGFIMDPIADIVLASDTTFLLMLEAQARGHEVLYCTPADLYVENGAPRAPLCPARVRYPRSAAESHYSLGPETDAPLKSLDLLFNRVDPPYSIEYVTMTQILGLIPPPTVVVNRPSGVLGANEKILALRFPEIMPPTIVTHEPPRLLQFLDRLGGKMIVKPLAAYGGIGVFVVEKNHTNKNVIIETATRGGVEPVVAQQYLPVGKKGDKRVILLAGEPIGAVLRLPAKNDHRANLHSGGRAVKTELTARDRSICRAIGPWLRREGLYLAGIDVVAGYLTEINITSPTLVKQINETQGVKLEARIMDFCEYIAESARAMKAERAT